MLRETVALSAHIRKEETLKINYPSSFLKEIRKEQMKPKQSKLKKVHKILKCTVDRILKIQKVALRKN